jgi:hypothetical protein
MPPNFSRLFPPPPTLISEKIAKIKKENPEFFEKEALEEEPKATLNIEEPLPEKSDSNAEPHDMSRSAAGEAPATAQRSFLDSWFKR